MGDVQDFGEESNNGTDPAVKNFAGLTLPKLEQHLQAIKDLDKARRKRTQSYTVIAGLRISRCEQLRVIHHYR